MALTKITPKKIRQTKPSDTEVALRRRTPLYVIFENIRSRYNVGAMFRTSDAALITRLFLTGTTPCPPHKDIDKSALGATEVVAWEYQKTAREVIAELKQQSVLICALERAKAAAPYTAFRYTFPLCLIVGNEVDGVSQEVLDLCDAAVEIPMLGKAHSLNVATAYGIALFEILRQYQAAHAHA